MARFIKYWLPVILWISVIFLASTDMGSPKHTSRFIVPFLRWLKPDINDNTIASIQFCIRKSGHAGEYAVLSLLLWRARRKTSGSENRSWRWQDALFAISVAALYAATDELHQYFVSNRQSSVWDVLLDTCGAVLAMIGLWGMGKWRKWF